MAKELGGDTTDRRLGRTTGCGCIDAKWCVNANSFEELQKRVNLRNNQQLLLKRQGTHWNGEHYVDGEPDPYITCLFGTHVIRLPFTRFADESMMVAYRCQLAEVWPHHKVILIC